ncbi:uncharacterized protein LOC130675917 [Microplitis mediator]|uniref:uncharacterized protein LOC130675917 n=1 Tax=Microplitis mediator TaxID=375433 RepID=UPI0025548B42|nr:uncharacterized protein LOC130675917 [Microplitis mediator]XP_057337802.1 uncharacterized protein LOC130675917 [Microplitis mediator]
MPGIHVRTSDKFDWIYREKEPLLTVPGSYWLCHKKNIYKFTFKYHRHSKDNKNFSHGKELMKVIRRIIKSQPRQGQQFGTRHLLVTYNHSSWTRQDKMFAMLKFRERTNATAFSRAFVLTVKLLSVNLIFQNGTEFDDLVEYDDNMKNKWDNIEQNDSKKSNDISQNIESVSTDNLEKMSDDSTEFKSSNSDSEKITEPFSSGIEISEPVKKSNVSFFADLKNLPILERYISEQRDPAKPDSFTGNNEEGFNEVHESIDMPYQYLIEREIERTNSKAIDDSDKQPVAKSAAEKPTRDLRNEPAIFRAKTFSTSNIIDNATARSANITDLVMEGLMFTISQNQDSITVLEQKTKSEPDEVLENSEKAETVKGSKHLINSSLLKLENLITNIEKSNNHNTSLERGKDKITFPSNIFCKGNLTKPENLKLYPNKLADSTDKADMSIPILTDVNKRKSTETKISESTSSQRLPMISSQQKEPAFTGIKDFSDHTHCSYDDKPKYSSYDNSFDSKSSIIENVLKHATKKINSNEEKKYSNDDKIYNQHEKTDTDDEDEEIIPEALQNDQSICRKIDETISSSIQIEESNLLMDDVDSEKQSHSLNESQLINRTNAPRVISNEAVQYDLSSLRTPKLQDLKLSSSNESFDARKKCTYSSESCSAENDRKSCEEIAVSNRKKLVAKRRLCRQQLDADNKDITIDMWKFLQDITHGVKVVLRRLNLSNISNNKNT